MKQWTHNISETQNLLRCDLFVMLVYYTGQQRKKTLEQQLPVLYLQTLLYKFLVSVSHGITIFLQKSCVEVKI